MSRLRTPEAALAAVLAVVAGAVVFAFILNSPNYDRFPDTANYEAIATHLPGSFISSDRMPGYPVVIALASLVPGGLLLVQSLMTVGSVVLTFFVARAALGNRWFAFVPAFLVATDLLMAGFARVGMTESVAVLETTAVAAAAVAFVKTSRPRYLWPLSALMIVLLLTRPEWALLAFALVPYALLVMWRRGMLQRALLVRAAAGVGAVVVCIGGYSLANLAVNGYFGMSSVVNVALMGKVMVYRMEVEAPPPYDVYIPQVAATGPALGPWPLTMVPPFNDRNHKLEGDFARAVILHDPVRFSAHVFGTLLDSSTAYDSVFIRIHDPATFSSQLKALLQLSELRYAWLVLLLPLALVWAVLGLVAPGADERVPILGALSVIALYGALTAAAATFDEFGRVHMPINPISTVLVAGTLLLNASFLFQRRVGVAMLAAAALIAEVAAAGVLPGRAASVMLAGLAVVALLQLLASGAGLAAGLAQKRVGGPDGERLGGHVDERQRERGPEPGQAAAQQTPERSG